MHTNLWWMATLVGLLMTSGCGAVRVSPREPAVDEATSARITRLGCGDTSAVTTLPRRPDSTFVVVRDPRECAELLTWMARWMNESFERWGTAASRERDGIARFVLVRSGSLVRVYGWFPAPASDGSGIAYEMDLRRRGEGVTGFSF